MHLPTLEDELRRFPGCCASVSKPLVAKIASCLPRSPALTLSVGSGTGLFEALLLENYPEINLEGVEVSERVNIYLPDDRVNVVGGTWDQSDKTSSARALIFVYAKQPDVVIRYLAQAADVECVIWLGPQADWQWFADEARAFEKIEKQMQPEFVEDLTVSYEKLVIYKKV